MLLGELAYRKLDFRRYSLDQLNALFPGNKHNAVYSSEAGVELDDTCRKQ